MPIAARFLGEDSVSFEKNDCETSFGCARTRIMPKRVRKNKWHKPQSAKLGDLMLLQSYYVAPDGAQEFFGARHYKYGAPTALKPASGAGSEAPSGAKYL